MKKRRSLAGAVFLFACSMVLLVACRSEAASSATATPLPSLPVTSTTPPVTPSPPPGTPVPALPDTAEALQRSQEMMLALPALGLEMTETTFSWPDAPPLIRSYQGCLRPGGAENADGLLSHMDVRLPGGISQRNVCAGAGEGQTCYSQVEDNAWFRNIGVEAGLSWPEVRGEVLAAATISESVAVAADGTVRVSWDREDWPVGGMLLQVESWLEPDTLLPLRESRTLQLGGVVVVSSEMTYTACEPVARSAAWPPPTVTPAPTVAPPVQESEIREEKAPLPGVLYVPEGEGPFPAVVVLHGSGGGVRFTDGMAQRLARGGLVAFAFCYFGCLDTPLTFEEIEITRVSEAIAYLRDRPDTVGEKVGVVGISRGADLALIMGVLDQAAGPVVSIMTSPWVHGSPDSAAPAAAWVYQGEPLPFTVIPVEKIDGPVLLLHGQEDHVWPVSFAYVVAERLAAHDHEYELIVYPHRGHELGIAPRDVLNQTTVFLHAHLAPHLSP